MAPPLLTMNIADLLFNAASGGVVGSLLHLGTSFFETWRKKKDAEVEILVMNAKVAAAEKEAAWNAFSASQKDSNSTLTIPVGVWPWVSSIYVLVDAFRQATRPGLTWAGFGFLASVYFSADPQVRATMSPEIQFGAWTLVFWWVGARYNKGAK